MQAAVLYGEHELPQYETVPDPVAGKSELLVKVEAAGVAILQRLRPPLPCQDGSARSRQCGRQLPGERAALQ
jgi:hypothetical protein